MENEKKLRKPRSPKTLKIVPVDHAEKLKYIRETYADARKRSCDNFKRKHKLPRCEKLYNLIKNSDNFDEVKEQLLKLRFQKNF